LNIRHSFGSQATLSFASTIFLTGLFFAGCSQTAPEKKFVTSSEFVGHDPSTERRSELLYRFLKGMTYVNVEDSGNAVKQFEAAAKLSDGNDELLRAQLVSLKIEEGDLPSALIHSQRIIDSNPQLYDYLIHAGILDSLGDFENAQKYYMEVIKARPDDIPANLYLANALYAVGKPDAAELRLRKLAKAHPDVAIIYYYLGGLANDQGNYSAAATYLKQAIKLEPDNKKIHIAYLATLINQEKIKEARHLTDKLSEEWQDESLSLVLKATQTLIEKGQPQSANMFLRSFLGEKSLEIQELRRHIGILQVQGRDFTGAVYSLGLVLAKDPNDARARYFLGTAYAAVNSKKRAVLELQKVPESEFMYVEAQTFAGFLLRQIGDLDSSEKAIRLAMTKLGEPDVNLQTFLVELLRAKHQYSEAANVVAAILREDPNNPKFLFLYGTILEDLGKHEEAIDIMESLIKVDPAHAQALNFIAYNLAERGKDLTRALSLVDKALADYPEDGYFLDTKGWTLYRLGRNSEAVKILSRAVNLTGDDPVIMEHYAEILLADGENERGLSVYLSIVQRKLDLNDPDIKKLSARSKSRIKELVSSKPELRRLVELSGYVQD
jgi:tetratricopeptide (TPR) repeat protein